MAKILVADDNSNIQKMAANALKDLGCEVVGFSNGESAVKKMGEVRPDLILADVFMPVRDGYELCDWVKKNEEFAHIPVFLLVGAFDPLDNHRMEAVKADGIIKKPFVPPDRLITVVQSMLERVAQQKHTESLKEAHDHFSQNVPHVEETQQLSDAEIKAMLAQGEAAARTPEPEPIEYAARTPQIDLGESSAPAFADLLGESGPELHASLETEAPSFQASAVEGAREGLASPHEFTEPPPSFDIKETQRQPTPDMPPIKVDFSGESEPMELVRDEPVAAPAISEVGRLEELVANPAEWMEQQAASAVPPPVAPDNPILEAELPPMPTISVEPEPPPAPEPVKPEPMGVPSADLPGLEWAAPAAPSAPVAAAPPPAPVPEAKGTPELIPAAPQVNPYVIDEIVDKVMMQLQPQIIHRITSEVGKAMESLQPRLIESIQKDIIRPIAEELLRSSTKK